MEIINVEQGSEAWHIERLNSFCASEAPMMMGASKYMSRNQLLDLKKGWEKNPDKSFIQKIFDKGHETEAQAREIVELYACESYPPVVGVRDVEGMRLLSSFDGLEGGEPGALAFEHKQWNAILAENVRNSTLEPSHYWQLEHQCLVNGNDSVLFVCSDGGEDNRVTMTYVSDPERQKELIAGWKQFKKDLANHEVKAKQEIVVGSQVESFPVINYKVEGALIISNIKEALPLIKERAAIEMSRTLETDQDFADKENLNKATVKARAMLKEVVERAKGEFVSFSEFSATAEEIDSVLQKMQAQGEKQVKQAKEDKKQDIARNANHDIMTYVDECSTKIKPFGVISIMGKEFAPDFAGAMKGKRTLESLQSAVDGVVAATKIQIDQVMAKVVPNQIYLREKAKDYSFLFNDAQNIINQDTEPFQAIVDKRIADHVKSEEVKAEALRESIRKEEAQKLVVAEALKVADKARVDDEEKRLAAESVEVPEVKEPAKEIPVVVVDLGKELAPATEDKKEPTFIEDIEAWSHRYSISEHAVKALTQILQKHGV